MFKIIFKPFFVDQATKSNMRISVKAVGDDGRYRTQKVVAEIPYHDDEVIKNDLFFGSTRNINVIDVFNCIVFNSIKNEIILGSERCLRATRSFQ